MKKAMTVSEIPNSFKERPLEAADMANFYEDTMFVRTGQEAESPIEDIYESCIEPQERNAFLLMGHWGCGKSTELNRLAERLRGEGFPAKTIYCNQELDAANIAFSDVMILMADALLNLADESKCKIEQKDLETIRTFWTSSLEKEDIIFDETGLSVSAGGELNAPLLPGLLKLFANLKTSLKYNVEQRTVYREKIVRYNSQWLSAINRVADQITEKTGKQPILIFEDLDKGNTWNVFDGHGDQLTGVTFPAVYTFPIAFSYRPAFSDMEGFFNVKRLPMIKIKNIDGKPNPDGLAVIRDIVERRASPNLFEENVLASMIELTGGSLRDLFSAINTAATYSRRRRKGSIDRESASVAFEELESNLSRRIEGADHDFLVSVYQGSHKEIPNREKLLEMMQAGTVLEYNGVGWFNVHPLIVNYLRDIGRLPKENEG